MAILIQSVKAPVGADENTVFEAALKKTGRRDAAVMKIHKTSLDARKREDIHFVHTVYAELESAAAEQKLAKRFSFVTPVTEGRVTPVISDRKVRGRVVIAGFGPAGMFAGLVLAENGYRPLILERGQRIEDRAMQVAMFCSSSLVSMMAVRSATDSH